MDVVVDGAGHAVHDRLHSLLQEVVGQQSTICESVTGSD